MRKGRRGQGEEREEKQMENGGERAAGHVSTLVRHAEEPVPEPGLNAAPREPQDPTLSHSCLWRVVLFDVRHRICEIHVSPVTAVSPP